MDVKGAIRQAGRAVGRAADATTMAAGAVGGAVLNGAISGVQGMVSGAQRGAAEAPNMVSAVPGAVVSSVVDGAQGAVSGARRGAGQGSQSTPVAAATLGVIGAIGVISGRCCWRSAVGRCCCGAPSSARPTPRRCRPRPRGCARCPPRAGQGADQGREEIPGRQTRQGHREDHRRQTGEEGREGHEGHEVGDEESRYEGFREEGFGEECFSEEGFSQENPGDEGGSPQRHPVTPADRFGYRHSSVPSGHLGTAHLGHRGRCLGDRHRRGDRGGHPPGP